LALFAARDRLTAGSALLGGGRLLLAAERDVARIAIEDDFELIHELVEQFIKSSNIDYEGFCWETINSGYTPIFEWMHPQKRIVIDYGKEPNLILTAIRHIVTGQYVSLNGDL
jgi:hypothetical protein